MGRFSPMLLDYLAGAGWHEGRQVEFPGTTAAIAAEGYEINAPARKILFEFCPLEISGAAVGTENPQVVSLWFIPERCMRFFDPESVTIEGIWQITHEPICPLGMTRDWFFFSTATGRIVSIDMYYARMSIQPSVEAFLECQFDLSLPLVEELALPEW